MQNDYHKDHDYENWDPETYRTGSTKPPKSRNGAVAVLLVLVILLCGIVSILGIVNIHLLRRINDSGTENTVPIAFSNTDVSSAGAQEATLSTDAATAATKDEEPISISDTTPVSDHNSQNSGLSLQEIYEKAIHSVVSISCTYQNGASSGTGVVLTADGYIVTNCHVVENAQTISVLLTDGRTIDAALVGMDAVSDLAVLSVSADGLVPAELGDSSALRVGDTVVAIGDPLGVELRGTMTDGIVSAINRDINIDGRTMNLIQTNAALNSGNSGGPLLNCYGQVIGINTMKMGDSMSVAGVEGLGFAIPSTTVKDVVNQLISQGFVSGRPALGITGESISPLYQFYYGLPQGLYITAVEEGSAAAAAGIAARDILLAIDSTRIIDNEGLTAALYSYEPGDTVQITVYRITRQYTGKQLTFTLTIGEAN